jgi:RHS repeat-associated protein
VDAALAVGNAEAAVRGGVDPPPQQISITVRAIPRERTARLAFGAVTERAFDGASNLTARTGPTATYTIDGENRPTSDGTNTLTWSNADRLTGQGSDTFGYDALDRLTSSTVASTSRTYAYDGDGLLQSRTQGTTTNFLWDPATSPSRLLAQGGDRIVYGLGPLYVIKADGTTRALARDGGKSVRAEVDGAGAVTGSWRYRAYGEINQTSGQSTPSALGYAGQLRDPSGLYYVRARWYDAATGRFLSRDPLSATVASPRTLNAYGYGAGNPVRFGDPYGLRVDIVAPERAPCTCFTPAPPKPATGDIQRAPDRNPNPREGCCITIGVARGPLTLIFPMPPKLDEIFRNKNPEDPKPPDASPPATPGEAPPGFVPKGANPASGEGSVWNPQTDEYWRWDQGGGREGPHWDYRDAFGKRWRNYPDGRWEPK